MAGLVQEAPHHQAGSGGLAGIVLRLNKSNCVPPREAGRLEGPVSQTQTRGWACFSRAPAWPSWEPPRSSRRGTKRASEATLTSSTMVHLNRLSASRSWNGIKEHLAPHPRFAEDAVTSRGQHAGRGGGHSTHILSALPPTSLWSIMLCHAWAFLLGENQNSGASSGSFPKIAERYI